MHLTLKKEATRPPGANILQQQAKFDAFLEEFNHERPHEALGMKCPAEIYSASCRSDHGIPEPHYPFHDRTVVVTSCGQSLPVQKKINLSVSLAGQAVGVKEVDHGIWLVSRFCVVAILNRIRNDRKLIQQIGRVLRTTARKPETAIVLYSKGLPVERSWNNYLEFETQADLIDPERYLSSSIGGGE